MVRNVAFGDEYVSNVSMTFHYANVYISEKPTLTTSCYFCTYYAVRILQVVTSFHLPPLDTRT